MHQHPTARPQPTADRPAPQEAYAWARQMFNRTLGQWATDSLALRRSGLERPCVRRGWWERNDGGAGGALGFPMVGAEDRRDDGTDAAWADAA